MTDPVAPDCRVCTRRFETGNPRAPRQCRALPPVQDLARDAGYPTVGEGSYCHLYFEADAAAVKARKDAAAETARLDARVAASQAQAEAAATPAQPELALEAGDEPKAVPRARRARPAAAK